MAFFTGFFCASEMVPVGGCCSATCGCCSATSTVRLLLLTAAGCTALPPNALSFLASTASRMFSCFLIIAISISSAACSFDLTALAFLLASSADFCSAILLALSTLSSCSSFMMLLPSSCSLIVMFSSATSAFLTSPFLYPISAVLVTTLSACTFLAVCMGFTVTTTAGAATVCATLLWSVACFSVFAAACSWSCFLRTASSLAALANTVFSSCFSVLLVGLSSANTLFRKALRPITSGFGCFFSV
mmetsp:Transcript_1349/g.2205  ORF Transcript_1349/g.2205 Transcript_1349/m.2205 type:complete len:246 (-) Transcript_1349:264-1001(-)